MGVWKCKQNISFVNVNLSIDLWIQISYVYVAIFLTIPCIFLRSSNFVIFCKSAKEWKSPLISYQLLNAVQWFILSGECLLSTLYVAKILFGADEEKYCPTQYQIYKTASFVYFLIYMILYMLVCKYMAFTLFSSESV